MQLKKFLCILLSTSCVTCQASTITAICPQASELTRTELTDSWAKYRYTGHTAVNLPAIGNTISFTGDSMAATVNYFYGATWTDHTFLCLYNYKDAAIVLYESQLAQNVSRCYFSTPLDSDCISSDPNKCPITCEI